MLNSNLLAYGRLGIPEALVRAHEELCDALAKATMEPGAVGKAAKQVEELCVRHFTKEEETIFRVFGLLQDLATDRVQPGKAVALPIISEITAQGEISRDHHRLIDAAIEELMQQARRQRNKTAAKVAHALKDHETGEDEVMYPTILSISQSLRESVGI